MIGVTKGAADGGRRRSGFWLAATVGGALLLAACGGTAPGGSAKPDAKAGGAQAAAPAQAGGTSSVQGDANNGKQLFSSKGCIACHVAPGVPGATGTIGPSLAGIGDPTRRPTLTDGGPNTPEHIKVWIQNPQQLKPGTMMPNLGLSDTEASDLTAFLMTLK